MACMPIDSDRYGRTVACDAYNAHLAGGLPYVCDLNPYAARRHRLGGIFHRDRVVALAKGGSVVGWITATLPRAREISVG